jgi:hypothetical protein
MWFWDLLGNIIGYGLAVVIALAVLFGVLMFVGGIISDTTNFIDEKILPIFDPIIYSKTFKYLMIVIFSGGIIFGSTLIVYNAENLQTMFIGFAGLIGILIFTLDYLDIKLNIFYKIGFLFGKILNQSKK